MKSPVTLIYKSTIIWENNYLRQYLVFNIMITFLNESGRNCLLGPGKQIRFPYGAEFLKITFDLPLVIYFRLKASKNSMLTNGKNILIFNV